MSKKQKKHDLFYIYGILNHPLRREVIEILGEMGATSYTELKGRFSSIRVGTLYYHFDILSGFITQDKEKRYMLTELGQEAYKILSSKEYPITSTKATERLAPTSESRNPRFLGSLVLPRSMFLRLYSKPWVSGIGALAIVGFGAWITAQAGLEPLMLFFNQAAKHPMIIFSEFILSILIIFGLSNVFSTVLFGRRGENLNLLIGTVYALLPLLVFPVLWHIDSIFNLGIVLFKDIMLTRIFLAILQGWTLCLLTVAVSLSKGLRIDRAGFIGLAIAYINITAVYILLRPF